MSQFNQYHNSTLGFPGGIAAQSMQGLQGSATLSAPSMPSPHTPLTLVAEAVERLSARVAHLHSVADRIERTTNRIMGCQPGTGAVEKNSEPTCEAHRLSNCFDVLDGAIARLERQAERVEQL